MRLIDGVTLCVVSFQTYPLIQFEKMCHRHYKMIVSNV